MATRTARTAMAAVTILILSASASASAPASADAPAPTEVLGGLQAWLDGTRDLECRFEQTLVSGAFGAGVRELGRLYVKRPGKMRWEYTRPDAKVAVLNDSAAFLYLPDDHQMIRGDETWSSSPLLVLLSGEGRVDDVFEVDGVGRADDEGAWNLRLVPRDADQGFEEVTVTLASPEYAISEAEVLDEAGNRMHYRFRSVRRNRGVDDDRFVLEPPPGTEIIVGAP
jgi:outer membrane lipoprotein carrier protein